jgi:hypothetical protein
MPLDSIVYVNLRYLWNNGLSGRTRLDGRGNFYMRSLMQAVYQLRLRTQKPALL